MKGLRTLLPLALIAAALAIPATSTAAPSPVHFTISSNAQYMSPTSIIVPITVNCPAGEAGSAFLFVEEQNLTHATGSGFTTVTCSGSAQTLAVVVTGTGFTPDKAYATGSACAFLCDGDTRQIQIVV
jgi:hypothetical protein